MALFYGRTYEAKRASLLLLIQLGLLSFFSIPQISMGVTSVETKGLFRIARWTPSKALGNPKCTINLDVDQINSLANKSTEGAVNAELRKIAVGCETCREISDLCASSSGSMEERESYTIKNKVTGIFGSRYLMIQRDQSYSEASMAHPTDSTECELLDLSSGHSVSMAQYLTPFAKKAFKEAKIEDRNICFGNKSIIFHLDGDETSTGRVSGEQKHKVDPNSWEKYFTKNALTELVFNGKSSLKTDAAGR